MNIQLSWHFPFSIVLPWNLCQKSIDHNCEGLNLSLLYLVFFPLYQVFWFSKTQRMAECPTIIHVLFSHVIHTSFRIAILILPTLWFSVHFLKWCTEKLTGSSGQEWSLSIVSFPLVWCGWTVSLKNPSNVVSMDPPRVLIPNEGLLQSPAGGSSGNQEKKGTVLWMKFHVVSLFLIACPL